MLEPEFTCAPQLLSDIALLAGTAAVVAASVARQENVSSRTRLLTQELRELVSKAASKGVELNSVQKLRLKNLPAQIDLFKKRLGWCVRGHILLYLALAVEVLGFGLRILLAFMGEPGFEARATKLSRFVGSRYPLIVNFSLFLIAMAFVLGGVIYHLREYRRSRRTIDLETQDILCYGKEIVNGVDAFLTTIKFPGTNPCPPQAPTPTQQTGLTPQP